MLSPAYVAKEAAVRRELTRPRLRELMEALARSAPREGTYRVYLVGGSTAVYWGWRPSSIDADLHSDREEVFRDIQGVKERLNLNVEFARPENFVPPVDGSEERHVFIETFSNVSFYHYDPYAQAFSKIIRGFERDLLDARRFIDEGIVDPEKLTSMVRRIPDEAYAKYPNLSRGPVEGAVKAFLA